MDCCCFSRYCCCCSALDSDENASKEPPSDQSKEPPSDQSKDDRLAKTGLNQPPLTTGPDENKSLCVPHGVASVNKEVDPWDYVPKPPPEEDPSCVLSSVKIGEIVPGLWIGGLGAVKELVKSPTGCSWTVVSVVKSDKLNDFVGELVEEMRRSHPGLIEKHLVWELADHSRAEFLSERLSEALQVIDEVVVLPQLHHRDAKPRRREEQNNGQRDDDKSNSPRGFRKQRNCLVHCAFGVSRSAAVCTAWLLSQQQRKRADDDGTQTSDAGNAATDLYTTFTTLERALNQVRTARPEASPNIGFIACLRALEQSGGSVELARERIRARTAPFTLKDC